jgi:hypothetical protein
MSVISVDADDFRNFQRTLKKINAEISKELNKELRRVLNSTIVPAARANASWSSRIPAAIRPTVGATKIGARVAARQAPHGRAFEGLQRGLRTRSSFRHPVFGNRNVWVEQATRPFLAPAFDSHAAEATKAAEAAIDQAARQAGFK